jgi:hypothetical protein
VNPSSRYVFIASPTLLQLFLLCALPAVEGTTYAACASADFSDQASLDFGQARQDCLRTVATHTFALACDGCLSLCWRAVSCLTKRDLLGLRSVHSHLRVPSTNLRDKRNMRQTRCRFHGTLGG